MPKRSGQGARASRGRRRHHGRFRGQVLGGASRRTSRLVVEFESEYNKTYCERPERFQRLVQMVAAELGRPVQLEFVGVLARATTSVAPPRPTAAVRRQLMRDVENHPLVVQAKQLFDAETSRVERDREEQNRRVAGKNARGAAVGYRVRRLVRTIHSRGGDAACRPRHGGAPHGSNQRISVAHHRTAVSTARHGRKSAERLTYHLLRVPKAEALALADAIRAVRENVRYCRVCFNLAEGEECAICLDPRRDRSQMCVVEQPRDLIALEQAGVYKGLYHVLLGRIAPLEGVGPDQLTLEQLVERVRAGGIREVIMATNPTVEGDGTALHTRICWRAEYPVQLTRLTPQASRPGACWNSQIRKFWQMRAIGPAETLTPFSLRPLSIWSIGARFAIAAARHDTVQWRTPS